MIGMLVSEQGGSLMKAYPMALRVRVIEDYDAGMSSEAVAEKYKVSSAWVRRLKQQQRERGDLTPRTGGGARTIKIDRQKLAALVEAQPDATLAELRERLGVACSIAGIHKALRELKLTFKKSRSTPRSRTAPTSPCDGRSGG
jgi:transposase